MAGGGSRPGERRGGRKRGTPNGATAAKAAAIGASGPTPLDYLLSVMRDATNPAHVRMEAAKAAAPYVHPKLAAVAHNSPSVGQLGAVVRVIEVPQKEAAEPLQPRPLVRAA